MIRYLLPAATSGADLIRAIGTVASALVVFAVMLYLAYMATKLIGKRYGTGAGKNLRVLESVPLGPGKQLFLVKVADKTLLLGAGKDRISCLAELDSDSLLPPTPASDEPLDFARALKQAAANRLKKQPPTTDTKAGKEPPDA